ncbi:MAG: hypothetical protein ABH829_04230 [archaeon]
MRSETSYASWYFLGIVLLLYALTGAFSFEVFALSLGFAYQIFVKVVPILFIIFGLMAVVNYYVSPDTIARYMGKESGLNGWLVAIVGGIISTGPLYMWYPLLQDIQQKGARNGLVAAFLYTRAIKVPLMPMMIIYFGAAYTIVLTFVIISFSFLQGIVVERIMEVWK